MLMMMMIWSEDSVCTMERARLWRCSRLLKARQLAQWRSFWDSGSEELMFFCGYYCKVAVVILGIEVAWMKCSCTKFDIAWVLPLVIRGKQHEKVCWQLHTQRNTFDSALHPSFSAPPPIHSTFHYTLFIGEKYHFTFTHYIGPDLELASWWQYFYGMWYNHVHVTLAYTCIHIL